MCHDAGIDAQVSIERYMKCGFGVCGQCCVDTSGERMCKEGPVVSNERARMIIEFGKYHRDSVGKIKNY
jgi:dihydroorotate dehydrogenase electron transfer subunit